MKSSVEKYNQPREEDSTTTDQIALPPLLDEDGAAIPDYNVPIAGFDDHASYKIANNRIGFGAQAVKDVLAFAARKTGGKEVSGEEYDPLPVVADAKQQLKEMTPRQKQLLNEFISKSNTSPWLYDKIILGDDRDAANGSTHSAQEDKVYDYVGRLIGTKEGGGPLVPKALFVNFLEWHNYELQKRQHELEKGLEKYINLFKEDLAAGIRLGWVPAWVNERIEERFANVRIAVDDGLQTSHQGAAGMHSSFPEEDHREEIVVSPVGEPKMERILHHEFIHMIDGRGGSFGDEHDRGMYRLFSAEEPGRALNEAVVEHLSHSLLTKINLDNVDPDWPSRKGVVYHDERKLLYALAQCGAKRIDVKDFVAAHFDDGLQRDKYGMTPTEHLKKQLREAFPDRDVLEELNELRNIEEIVAYAGTLEAEKVETAQNKRSWKATAKVAAAIGAAVAVLGGFAGMSKFSKDIADPSGVQWVGTNSGDERQSGGDNSPFKTGAEPLRPQRPEHFTLPDVSRPLTTRTVDVPGKTEDASLPQQSAAPPPAHR